METGTRRVLGHAKLSDGDSKEGQAGLVHSVVVSPLARRMGLGGMIMSHLEEEARRVGKTFLFLRTPDMVKFYEKCGYSVTDKGLSSLGANAKRLNTAQVEALEAVLRAQCAQNNSGGEVVEDGDEAGTWLRKRIVDELPLTPVEPAQERKEICKGLRMLGAGIPEIKSGVKRWIVQTVGPAVWQKQVSP